jgi:hypothetical protein
MSVVVRNDSDMSVDEAIAFLDKAGTMIAYGGIAMKCETRALADAREHVAALSPQGRARSMASVDVALRRSLPKMKSGRFSKKVADNFHSDLLLWHALKEVGGQ